MKTTHDLAKEAAEKLDELACLQSVQNGDVLATTAIIIHTTAVQPVIEAGEELARLLNLLDKQCDHLLGDDIDKALTAWRTLTADKNSQQNAANGPRSDFDVKQGSEERKG